MIEAITIQCTFIISSSTRWTDIRRVSLLHDNMQCPNGLEDCLQFGMKAPTFAPLTNAQTIISRAISTVPVHPNFLIQVNYTLSTVNSPDCLNTGSFTAPPPQLQYRVNGTQMWTSFKFGSFNDIYSYAIHFVTSFIYPYRKSP